MVEKSRVQGCLFGLDLGDALGAPFEGSPPGEDKGLDLLLDSPPPVLCYTDDTEMAIGVAESLIRKRVFDPADMARRFVDNFDPRRGYGPGTVAVLGLIRKGIPYSEANKTVFPEGSFGNGAAMRSAPLGLFAQSDMQKLKTITYGASGITHAHPLAMEGAFLIAQTVALLSGGMKRDDITARLTEPGTTT